MAAVTLLNFQFARNKINEIHVASAQVSTATCLMETDTQTWHETAHPLIISNAALPVRVAETRSDSLAASAFDSRVKAQQNGFHENSLETANSTAQA